VGKYSLFVFNEIIEMYNNRVFKFSGSSDLLSDAGIKKVLAANVKALAFFNCALFPVASCKDATCMGGHIAVFASDQTDNAGNIMAKEIRTLFKKLKKGTERDRINLQAILQEFLKTHKQCVKIVEIHYKNWEPHDVYFNAYIEETNKLAGKADAYVYVRASSGSDYGDFATRTALTPLSPCVSLT
jgi:hypothetical protein